MIKFFGYNKCSTCLKAKKKLKDKGVNFEDVDIVENPPSKTVLNSILKSKRYELTELFNRSGQLYRSMNIKEKIKTISQAEAVDLLAQNGKLIKRPIVSDGNKKCTVGFKEEDFTKAWL